MSTRATYKITQDRGNTKTSLCFYIHHDGYPEGAACYFHNMHTMMNKKEDGFYETRGGFVENFVRANKRAEITKDHDSTSDTDYQYDLEADGTLTATKLDFYFEDDNDPINSKTHETKEVFFKGHYSEFVNKYLEKEEGNSFKTTIFKVEEKIEYSDTPYTWYLTGDEINERIKQARKSLGYITSKQGVEFERRKSKLEQWLNIAIECLESVKTSD